MGGKRMTIYENGTPREMTKDELEFYKSFNPYENYSYDDLVDLFIRESYSASAEFAILRQRDTKPEEYKKYFDYCEECKTRAKEIIGENE